MSDDNVSPAARLPGGDQPAAERPLDPQDLPEHLAEPTQMPSTGPQVAQAVVEAVGGTPRADGMVDAAKKFVSTSCPSRTHLHRDGQPGRR